MTNQIKKRKARGGLIIRWFFVHYSHLDGPITACKESRVRQPRASGFCDRASEFVPNLPDGQAKIFQRIKITKVLVCKYGMNLYLVWTFSQEVNY